MRSYRNRDRAVTLGRYARAWGFAGAPWAGARGAMRGVRAVCAPRRTAAGEEESEPPWRDFPRPGGRGATFGRLATTLRPTRLARNRATRNPRYSGISRRALWLAALLGE